MYEKMSEKERLMVEVTKDVTGLSRDKAELAVGAAILATTSKEAVSSTMEAFEVVEELFTHGQVLSSTCSGEKYYCVDHH